MAVQTSLTFFLAKLEAELISTALYLGCIVNLQWTYYLLFSYMVKTYCSWNT